MLSSGELTLHLYEHSKEIGSGGFGTVSVYLLKMEHRGRTDLPSKMAVKVITNQSRTQLREVEMCKLVHPNLVSFHGVEEEKSIVHIKMEAANCNLAHFQDKIIKRAVNRHDFLHFALQLAEGLKYLHKNGITHRDIKRDNILVFWNEATGKVESNALSVTLKLCDFGLSRFNPNETFTMTAVGTLSYAAPEVANAIFNHNMSVRLSYRKVDIFSMGMVYYQLLFSKLPFSQNDLVSKERKCIDVGKATSKETEDLTGLLSLMLAWENKERINVGCVASMIRSFGNNAEVEGSQLALLQLKYSDQLELNKAQETHIAQLLQSQAEQLDLTDRQEKLIAQLKTSNGKKDEQISQLRSDMTKLQFPKNNPRYVKKASKDVMVKDVDVQSGKKPLHKAAQDGNLEEVKWLIDSGDDVNRTDKFGWTPLHYACQSGHVLVAQMLIGNGADVYHTVSNGWTLLHHASKYGHLHIAQLLIERGANINRVDRESVSPFETACVNDHPSVAKLLIEKGANVSKNSQYGSLPLLVALSNNMQSVVQLLIEKGANVNDNSKDTTPLTLACSRGMLTVAQLLIEKGAEINRADKDGCTPLHSACENGKLLVAQLLIEKGADINKANDGKTILHLVCRDGNLSAAQLLIEKGAEINIADKEGGTPLHFASRWSFLSCPVDHRERRHDSHCRK